MPITPVTGSPDCQLSPASDGTLFCHTCEQSFAAEELEVKSLRRVEGASDPEYQALEVRCLPPCPAGPGTEQVLRLGYGPGASRRDALVVEHLGSSQSGGRVQPTPRNVEERDQASPIGRLRLDSHDELPPSGGHHQRAGTTARKPATERLMLNRTAMSGLTSELLGGSSSDHEAPCLSLYQPTHRHHPENQQGPIRFRNLVKEMEASLRQNYPNADTQRLLEPFEALAHDAEFWNHTLDGLAVLARPGSFLALRIPQSVAELVVVADSFHTKPLRRFLQSVDRYQVLGLSLDKIRLFEGNRHALDELELVAGVPRTIAEALGGQLTEPHQTVASYGGVGGAGNRMHHGQGGKADEADIDAERFFRAVDRAVLEHYSKPSGLPLILAALPEHHHLFRQVSQNPLLIGEGIGLDPDSLPADELRSLAWQAFEPRYQARLSSLSEEFEQARSNGAGSDDLTQVAAAAAAGRVATLLLQADRQIAGRLDGAAGRIEITTRDEPHVADLFDELAELVTTKGGSVLVIPAERMPSLTGLAAIYRY